MEISRNNIFELMAKADVHPTKDYGQNFLCEPSIAKKIVDSLAIEDDDKVLEIGPGLGSLTNFLLHYDNQITVVDIDYTMTSFLREIYQDFDNLKIITNDIRKEDVSQYDLIIGNLPYNITTELITFLLINSYKCKNMVLMCQSETYEHFSSLCGSEYGPSSILIHLLGTISKVLVVKAGSFIPVPKCSSTVFSIEFYNTKDREKCIRVYKMCRTLFINRRKTINNNLSLFLNDKEKARMILNSLNIPLNSRPEDISPELYIKIYDSI